MSEISRKLSYLCQVRFVCLFVLPRRNWERERVRELCPFYSVCGYKSSHSGPDQNFTHSIGTACQCPGKFAVGKSVVLWSEWLML